MSKQGTFEVKQVTSFQDLVSGKVTTLGESDLAFQSATDIIQLAYKDGDDERKLQIKPGFYTLIEDSAGLRTTKIEFRKRDLLEDVTSTKSIISEARLFFSKLEVYEKLNRPKKRGVLLYSAPGYGKSSSIEKFCVDFANEDAGTVVIVWPTSEIEADSIVHFFSHRAEYAPDCTRVILIIEDIGGREPGDYRGSQGVNSGLLNLLDGIGVTFKLPTFIVATTNHPESLLQALADRPGRFDRLIKLNPPTHDEKIRLLTFISKRELTDDEKDCIGKKGTEDFSVAHLEEIAVRSLLHDKSYMEVVQEMIEHTKLFKKNFEEKDDVGFGFSK
jgi:SpoVK/Ycf46/Vps4 family AAA+-type ATPase